MFNTKLYALTTMVFFLAFFGCRKDDNIIDSNLSFNTDMDYFKYIANTDASYGDLDELSGDDVPDDFSNGIISKINAVFPHRSPIIPKKFGKKIESVFSQFSVDSLNDSLRILHITKILSGTFILIGIQNDTDTVRVEKPFSQTSQRKLKFVRIARTRKIRDNWKPREITVGAATTAMTQDSFAIQSLSVKNLETGDSTIVSSPLEHWFTFGVNGSIFHTHKRDSVRVKLVIVSNSPDTEIVALRVGRGRKANFHRRHSIPLATQFISGSGYVRTFEKIFEVHGNHGEGRFNGVFEVMSHNSIYDDSVNKYTSAFWSIPYRVERK